MLEGGWQNFPSPKTDTSALVSGFCLGHRMLYGSVCKILPTSTPASIFERSLYKAIHPAVVREYGV